MIVENMVLQHQHEIAWVYHMDRSGTDALWSRAVFNPSKQHQSNGRSF